MYEQRTNAQVMRRKIEEVFFKGEEMKRRKHVYLFQGKKEMAYSKDKVLRAHGLSGSPKNYAKIVKIKQTR